MKIEKQEYDTITVIQLQGEFTEESVQSFRDVTGLAITDGAESIVLDMSKVVSLDSKSLEQLLWLNDYCRENARQLKIAALDETCLKILEITRLLPEFDTYAELTDAVKSHY